MNSYTHSGFSICRRLKEDTIEANMMKGSIEILGFSDAIGMLTALQIALMAGNVELANDLLENPNRIEEALTIPADSVPRR